MPAHTDLGSGGRILAGILAIAVIWWLAALRKRLKNGEAGPRYAFEHPDEETTAVSELR